MRVWNGPKIDIERGETVGDFPNATFQSMRDRSGAGAVVGRAQWLRNTIRADGDHRSCGTCLGALYQLQKEFPPDLRHIASQDQIPLGVTAGQCGMQARERPMPGKYVLDHTITKVSVSCTLSDQGYIVRDAPRLFCHVFDQRMPFHGEQRFIAAHARTAAPGQYERGALHGEMITLGDRAELVG